MDKIHLNKMEFYGYHGVFPEETKLGQRFFVNVTLSIDLKKAGKSDHLADTVNYAEVYKIVKEVVEGPAKRLIEAVCEEIATKLLHSFPNVTECQILLDKPNPPIPGHYNSVAVEMTRSRDEK